MTHNRKKDYRVKTVSGSPSVAIDDYRQPPWQQIWAGVTYDFRRWRYVGWPQLDEFGQGCDLVSANRDCMVKALRNAVWRMKRSDKTKLSYCASGLRYFFAYLDFHNAAMAKYNMQEQEKAAQEQREPVVMLPLTELAHIDKTLLENYIHWLRHTCLKQDGGGYLGYNTTKQIYGHTKAPLNELVRQKLLPLDIFPANPFPRSNRSAQSHKRYSKPVFKALLRALAKDIRGLQDGTLRLSGSQRLTVYLMVIAARSGRNPTPLLNVTRGAMLSHPIKPRQMGLLVTYKNRGNTTSVQTFEYSDDQRQIEDIVSLPMDAVSLFHQVNTLTAPLTKEAAPGEGNNLWLHCPTIGKNKGQVMKLTQQQYWEAAKSIVKRHGLQDEDGQPLKLNISRLRATFSQRMWELTEGDHIKTAQLNGNTPKVTDEHYLEVTPEMKSKHRTLGLLMHAMLSGTTDASNAQSKAKLDDLSHESGIPVKQLIAISNGDNNTGTGRCIDPKSGEYAPKDGTDCTNWLNCFKCKDQIVLECDLYRLFSFYFLLIKERNFMTRDKWATTYGWVVDSIDNEIVGPNLHTNNNPSGSFNPLRVKCHRERAEHDPHPMWRDRAILQLGSEQ